MSDTTNAEVIEMLEALLDLARTRYIRPDSVSFDRESESFEVPGSMYIRREPTGWATYTFTMEVGPPRGPTKAAKSKRPTW